MNNNFDTICAIATPLSVGGVGVIRVSGERSYEIVQKYFSKEISPKKINHGWIVDGEKRIDEVILLPFIAPNSFTGEDVIEIQTHGSPVVVKEVLNLLLGAGARLAERGEFTKRAFLNHKIDMTQAEAVLDLMHAKTEKSANLSASNLAGALRVEINNIKQTITEILAKIIASLDFPEDVAEVDYRDIETVLAKAVSKIDKILNSARSHNILREGAKVAIVGQPNVGKSSLFNALLSLNRAIVTDVAGTTRDTINETLDIKGIALTLTDTAGIRDDENIDKVEQIGISNAKEAIAQADLILCLYDGLKSLQAEDEAIFAMCPQGVPKLLISTKADICADGEGLKVSSVTLFGIDELKDAIYNKIIGLDQLEFEFSTNQRQQECLRTARRALENALNETRLEQLQDLISIDIKSALLALDEITGELVTDDILTHIFENFCIGK